MAQPLRSISVRKPSVRLDVSDDFRRSRLLPALIVDDDEPYAENLRDALDEVGYGSTVVHTLQGARDLLAQDKYALIVCDNVFEPEGREHASGSEFIAHQSDIFGEADVVLLTGYAVEQIKHRAALDRRGVKILRKAPGHFNEVRSIASAVANQRKEAVETAVENFVDDLVSAPQAFLTRSDLVDLRISRKLVSRATAYLRRYVESFPDQDKEQFYIMGKTFSPRALLEELREGTEVAVHLIDIFLDDVLEA